MDTAKKPQDDPALTNPQEIHDEKLLTDKIKASAPNTALGIPVADYYRALALAKKNYDPCFNDGALKDEARNGQCEITASQERIVNYQEEGIALVDAYCRRWFQSLSERERFFNFEQQNWNVIKQLGTTMLGLGGANSVIVSVYGAVNTANDGLQDSYKNAFFFSPSVSRVKQLVLGGMKEHAAKLRREVSGKTFKQVYTDMEAYADSCTFNSIRAYISDSVMMAELYVGPSGGLEVRQGSGIKSPDELIRLLNEAQARTKKDQADRELTSAEEDARKAQTEVASKTADLERQKTQLAEITKAKGELSAKLQTAQPELSAIKDEHSSLTKTPEANRSDVEKQRLLTLVTTINRKEKDIQSILQELEKLAQAEKEATAAIANIGQDITKAKTRLDDANNALAQKKAAATAAEKEYALTRERRTDR